MRKGFAITALPVKGFVAPCLSACLSAVTLVSIDLLPSVPIELCPTDMFPVVHDFVRLLWQARAQDHPCDLL